MAADADSAALEDATVTGLTAVILEFKHAWLGAVGESPGRDASVDLVLDLLIAQAKRRAAQALDARFAAEWRARDRKAG
jgi:hypothetical protein